MASAGMAIAQIRCDACEDAIIATWEATQRAADEQAAEARFWSQVPPLYRNTEKSRLPAALVAAIDRYEFGPVGLALLGKAGEGKTRAAVMLLHRLAREGRRT
jgi:DNA replication protein DnaC